MGTEAVWVPLVMAAVSGAATYINNRNTARRQDHELAAQLRAQGDKQREADARTAQLLTQQAQSTDAKDRTESLATYNRELAMKAPQANKLLAAPGAVSDAYQKSGSDASLGIADYGKRIADLTASIDAPQQQRMRDRREIIDPYQTDIGMIARRNAGDNFLSNLRLRNIQPNPWLSLTAGIAGAAAGSYAKGMGAGTAGASMGAPADAYSYMAPSTVNSMPNPWIGYPIGSI